MLAEFGTGQVFWSMIWFFLFFMWIWLIIVIFSDIFRSHDLSGWAKALWTIFVIFVPFLGIFVYLIARGSKMRDHAVQDAQAKDEAMRAYVQNVTSSGGTADECHPADDSRRGAVIASQTTTSAPARRETSPDPCLLGSPARAHLIRLP